jgi:hypothetical protein
VAHEGKIVGDVAVGDSEAALEVLHQVHDLGRDRDFDGQNRLVGNGVLKV